MAKCISKSEQLIAIENDDSNWECIEGSCSYVESKPLEGIIGFLKTQKFDDTVIYSFIDIYDFKLFFRISL